MRIGLSTMPLLISRHFRAVLWFAGLLWSTFSLAQTSVHGIVTDESGEPLPFASIYIHGTTKGTTSNAEGKYSLELAPGTYQIVYQYIGYRSANERLLVPVEGLEHHVALKEDVLELKTVEVLANREDPAYAIIRKAQAKRKDYLDQVEAYQCKAYVKGSFKLLETPEKIMGVELGDMDGVLDSTGQGYIYLSESVSNIYYQAPNRKKEVMISSIVSGDPQGFSFNQASGMDFDFYQNVIQFSRALVSPIASNAFDFYRYQLEGVVFDNEGRMVNKILVIPRVKESAAFEGTIYITEDLWNIHDVDLFITSRALKQPIIDTLWLKQIHIPVDSKDGEKWMVFHQQLKVKVGLFGFYSIGDFSAIFSEHNLDPKFAKDIFDANRLVVEDGANERDSQYWESIRPIPLTEAEAVDYTKKDSLRQIWESPEYLDSVDREGNKFRFSGALMSGYSHNNSRTNTSWGISSPLLTIYFNPVQGYQGKAGFRWSRMIDKKEQREVRFRSDFQYGLAERILNPDISLTYRWDPLNSKRISIAWSRGLHSFDPSVPISPLVAAWFSNYDKQHYLKLFREQRFEFAYTGDLSGGVRLKISGKMSQRNGVNNKSDFSIIENDEPYPVNMPLELPVESFQMDKQFVVGMEINWRPGMKYWLFPDKRIPIGSAYPVFTLGYEKAMPMNEHGADWDRIRFSVQRRNLRIGSLGNLDAVLRAGAFLSNEQVAWPDRFHYNGNEVFLVSGSKYANGFMMMPYFKYSNTSSYGSIHLEHHFNGLLLDRIPLINKLGWKTVIGYSRLQQPGGISWNEVVIGLEHIGISVYRGIRVNAVGGWGPEGKMQWGFRMSVVNALGIQL